MTSVLIKTEVKELNATDFKEIESTRIELTDEELAEARLLKDLNAATKVPATLSILTGQFGTGAHFRLLVKSGSGRKVLAMSRVVQL